MYCRAGHKVMGFKMGAPTKPMGPKQKQMFINLCGVWTLLLNLFIENFMLFAIGLEKNITLKRQLKLITLFIIFKLHYF